jgi:hypothetical protein
MGFSSLRVDVNLWPRPCWPSVCGAGPRSPWGLLYDGGFWVCARKWVGREPRTSLATTRGFLSDHVIEERFNGMPCLSVASSNRKIKLLPIRVHRIIRTVVCKWSYEVSDIPSIVMWHSWWRDHWGWREPCSPPTQSSLMADTQSHLHHSHCAEVTGWETSTKFATTIGNPPWWRHPVGILPGTFRILGKKAKHYGHVLSGCLSLISADHAVVYQWPCKVSDETPIEGGVINAFETSACSAQHTFTVLFSFQFYCNHRICVCVCGQFVYLLLQTIF